MKFSGLCSNYNLNIIPIRKSGSVPIKFNIFLNRFWILSFPVSDKSNLKIMKKISIVAIATLLSIIAFGQDRTVQMFGKILDENKNPIANVKIVLKGTKYETVTNSEGQYFFMIA